MKLLYLQIWLNRMVYIHQDCPKFKDGFPSLVDSFKRVCCRCKEKYVGQMPHEINDDTLEIDIRNYDFNK